MKHLHALAALALAGLPAPPAGTVAEQPVFEEEANELPDRPYYAPDTGEAVSFRYALTTLGELDALTLKIDGEDFSRFVGDLDLEFTSDAHYEVTDVVLESGSGQAQRLRRSFDELRGVGSSSLVSAGGEDRVEVDFESPLEGLTVVFSWNDEDELYDAEFDPARRSNPGQLLAALDEDMSLRRLLPPEPAGLEEDEAHAPRPGDTWEIEYSDLLRIVFPGGNLGLVPEDTGEFEEEFLQGLATEVTGVLRERVPGWLRGSSTASYAGARPEGEDVLDDIELAVDLELEADLRELFQGWGEALLEEGGTDWRIEFTRAELECELEGAGELTWSRAAGQLDQFVFEGEHETELDLALDLTAFDTTYQIEVVLEFHGEWGTRVDRQ